jgi:hypothetical protein
MFDEGVLAKYPSPFNKKAVLDTLHDSWSPLWLFPKAREISPHAVLANSVAIRCQEISSYRPGNLSLVKGMPAATYAGENVVI